MQYRNAFFRTASSVVLFATGISSGLPTAKILSPGDLVISELWVAPEEGPEWIEIFNPSQQAWPIRSVALRRNGKRCGNVSSELLESGQRFVWTSDTAAFRERYGPIRVRLGQPNCWLSLPNSGGNLTLLSSDNLPIDSVEWSSVSKERSLFRPLCDNCTAAPPTVMEVGFPGDRSSPGFEVARPTGKEEKIGILPRGEGDPIVVQIFLNREETLKWSLFDLSGKTTAAGFRKGAEIDRLVIDFPPGRRKPLWFRWSLAPGGESGSIPLWRGEK